MPIPKEICVFLPCHTLEDFPTHLRDEAASGLLAAWTSPWHPRIVAAVGGVPSWNRADTPPVEMDHRLLLVPSASESRLPSDFEQRLGDSTECKRLHITTRAAAVQAIFDYFDNARVDDAAANQTAPQTPAQANSQTAAELTASGPGPAAGCREAVGEVTVGDFFALGFAMLQVQLMTRQLRYSSNLDQVVFAEHVFAAAQAWVAGRGEEAKNSLHSAFDLLAEERDHYFSADPHLIDLVLVAESTLGEELAETLRGDQPLNLLMSARVAETIRDTAPAIAARIAERHRAGTLSIAGGAADDTTRLETRSGTAVGHWLREGVERIEQALGLRPKVFGRLGGGIPGDLPSWLVAEKFVGAITSDFTAGVGSQEEAKLMWQSGGAEIEALTARPLDADQPQSYLGIGPRMGEAADRGEVATALLVRWPGSGACELEDLRRAARWGLALGRFWTLDKYFTEGERPYHTCTLPSVTADGASLTQAVSAGVNDPLSGPAREFVAGIEAEARGAVCTLATLVSGDLEAGESAGADSGTSTKEWGSGSSVKVDLGAEARRLARAIGLNPSETAPTSSAVVLNPHSGPSRVALELQGPPPASDAPGLFGATRRGRVSVLTVDTPGQGFTTVVGDPHNKRSGPFRLRNWFRKPKPLASGQALGNEFLDVAIHPQSGGIAAVHAGAQRGNRFSWQLARFDAGGPNGGYSQMQARQLRVTFADTSEGVIEVSGEMLVENRAAGEFSVRYSLRRGSRWLLVDVELKNCEPLGSDPWRSYIAGRAAWSSDALSVRALVRDKRLRTGGRRIEAPLGVFVDEGDRKLQVCGFGLSAHRRIGGQRLDTLLRVAGETGERFRLAYGFDVSSPVRAARHQIVPPSVVSLVSPPAEASRGWLVDVDARSVVLTDWECEDQNTFRVRAIETSGKPVQMRLRAFRDLASVERIVGGPAVSVEGDTAILRLAGHETTELRVRLANPAS